MWIRLEHAELEIPVSLPQRDVQQELELRRGARDRDGRLGIIRLQLGFEIVGVGDVSLEKMCATRSDLGGTLRSTTGVH